MECRNRRGNPRSGLRQGLSESAGVSAGRQTAGGSLRNRRTALDGGGVVYVSYSADGRRLATGDKTGDVKVWDSEAGQEPVHSRPSLALPALATRMVGLLATPSGQRPLLAVSTLLRGASPSTRSSVV